MTKENFLFKIALLGYTLYASHIYNELIQEYYSDTDTDYKFVLEYDTNNKYYFHFTTWVPYKYGDKEIYTSSYDHALKLILKLKENT